jgi:hypothetical protein
MDRRFMFQVSLAVVALGAAPERVIAQQAGFGTELFKREAWTVRLDASADPTTTTLVQAGDELTLASRAAALAWRPRDRAAGDFTVRAVVQLPSESTGGAGLFFGGYDLEGMDRNFAVCMVRSDGSWSIPHRNGVELHNFRAWTRHEAVSGTPKDGRVANLVEWVVDAERVRCRINGQEIYSFSRPSGIVPGGLRTIDGDVGIRVDAGVSALFKGFAVIKP